MKKIIFFITLLFSQLAFANPQFAIVIDAGDHASTLHFFQYEHTETIPSLKEIFKESNDISLADFEKNPENAGLSLKKLLDDANEKVSTSHTDAQSVSLFLLGTEKMRSLKTETQKSIYTHTTEFINHNYKFSLKKAETVSGKMQGVYAWLDANYIAENFQENAHVTGLIQTGDFSTQIAYSTSNIQKPEDMTKVQLGIYRFTVFSKNFTTLNETQTRKEMNKNNLSYACYPINYPLSENIKGNFNNTTCGTLYSTVFQDLHIASELPPYKDQTFLISGNTFRIYDFLGAADPDQYAFEARLYYACSLPWNDMKVEYDNFSEQALSVICADSVFTDKLIYDALHLHGEQLWVTDKIDGQQLDWPLGALLFSLTNEKR